MRAMPPTNDRISINLEEIAAHSPRLRGTSNLGCKAVVITGQPQRGCGTMVPAPGSARRNPFRVHCHSQNSTSRFIDADLSGSASKGFRTPLLSTGTPNKRSLCGMNAALPALIGVGLLLFAGSARADTVLASKHGLSASGPGTVRATAESDVCLFCHTPHRGTGEQPLWNHSMSKATYTPYSSSTARAAMGQPTGASKLCLSRHDGTVALGMVQSRSLPIPMRNQVTTMPPGRSNLGTDLSDDHPISVTYDSSLAVADGQLKDPATLKDKVRLDHEGQLQCTSCHDPHNNQYGKFLVQDNTASALCLNCHRITSWDESIHKLSTKSWNGSGLNPWPHTTGTSVAANACENCHAPHTAGTKQRLLNFADEEQ